MTVLELPLGEGRAAEVNGALARVLTSPCFAQSVRQQQLLTYLVQQSLAGRGDLLKGYTIAVDVFGREESFDPRVDSIVRVEIGRLRSKLREYYDADGRSDAIRIDLPKGSYAVHFAFRENGALGGPNGGAAARPVSAVMAVSDTPSIAVLPFVNMSSDPEQEYFADGMTEDLITALSKLSGLLVIARQSVFAYKGGVAKDARDIARELGVQYLLEGSVRRAAKRVRINAQLVEAASGTHIWAESYDRDLEDIFAVQDDVTRHIVEKLEVSLSDADSKGLIQTGTESVDAHDLLLRGLERFWEYTPDSMNAAQGMFAKALELDPNYGAAHSWLARAYIYRYAEHTAGEEVLELAYRHARKAIECNPRLPFGYSVLGWANLWRRQGPEAISAARRAVAMDPNSADAHMFLAVIMASNARGEEGLRCIEKAMRLNPFPSAFYLLAKGLCLVSLERLEDSIPVFDASVKLRPAFIPCRAALASVYARLGRDAEAAKERDAVLEMQGVWLSAGRARPWTPDFWCDEELRARVRDGERKAGLRP